MKRSTLLLLMFGPALFVIGLLLGTHRPPRPTVAPEAMPVGAPVFLSRPLAGGGWKIERLRIAQRGRPVHGEIDVRPDDWYIDWNGTIFVAEPAP